MDEVQALFKQIVDKYCEIRNIKELPQIKVELSDDLYATCLEGSAESLRQDIMNQKEWMDTIHGTIIYPEKRTDTWGIIIRISYVMECINQKNNNWIGTLCHELTHVLDYIRAMELFNDLTLEEFKWEDNYPMFVYWTEYNARRFGHYLLRYYTHGEDMTNDIFLKDIIKREMPFQINYLSGYFVDGASKTDAIYMTVHFCGRLKVWKTLFPNYFTSEIIQQILGNNGWMEELYCFLDENDTIEKAINCFKDMEKILKRYS